MSGGEGSGGRFVSYAQNLEDVMLWRALGDVVPEGGFYVDVGASDPTLLSVTRAFYERGWRGVDVEPLPEQAALLAKVRPRDAVVQAQVGAAPGRAAFYRVWRDRQTGLSTSDADEAERHRAAGACVERIETAVVTLGEVLRAHVTGPVHFLKIDVEGAEEAVLAGLDLSAVRPWIVVVEAVAALTEASSVAWEAGLLAAGYGLVWFDGLNRFYLAEEHAELARHFRVQPNVFDHYAVYDPVLQPQLDELRALAQERLEAKEAAEAERDRLRGGLAEGMVKPGAGEQGVAVSARAVQVGVRRSLRRRLAMGVYMLVRPVIRPMAWRMRDFLVGDVRRELFEVSERQAMLLSRSPAGTGAGAVDASFVAAMERLLLTLALEQGRDGGAVLHDAGPGLSNAESGH